MTDTFRPMRLAGDVRHGSTFVTAQVAVHSANPATQLARAFQGVELAHVLVFATPQADFAALMKGLSAALGPCPVVGCTSAGEIGRGGYLDDHIVAVGLPRKLFSARTVLIQDLGKTNLSHQVDRLIQNRVALRTANRERPNGFAFLMVDGLSQREDALVSALTPALGYTPLFGGSAGDGINFERTYVGCDGHIYEDAATVTFVATACETQVFSVNHMVPSKTRMVVTEADPERRVVKEINAEPAAQEYARLVGKDSQQLDELTFAAHPVMVRIGEDYHVRAIQRMNKDGDLVFFSAIDEGMVLTTAEPRDMASHLDASIEQLVKGRAKPDILGCDCILRRIEAQKSQTQQDIGRVLERHEIVGFSTYGEQIGPLHVNHTLTGVAIFPKSDQVS